MLIKTDSPEIVKNINVFINFGPGSKEIDGYSQNNQKPKKEMDCFI